MNGTVRQSPAMDIQRRSCFNARGGCALPGLHSPCAPCRPGKRSAARQWAQEMNGSVRQSPTIGKAFRASPFFNARGGYAYRAYILLRDRPGKRSAARQQAQEMNGTVRQSPAMDIQRRSRFTLGGFAPYRAYIPARPGRSALGAARHQL
ncbi:hypothetical protein WHV81_12565 [Klebsiella pneumoniae]